MYTQLFKEIKGLTKQAVELVESNKIEQCNNILVKRQLLLEKVALNYEEIQEYSPQDNSASENKKIYTKHFIELIRWVQQHDHPAIIDIKHKQEQSKERSMTQIKTKKALQQYRKLL